MSRWPKVALGELITPSDVWVDLVDDGEYRELTVRQNNRGVELRRVVTGAEVAARRRREVQSGEFIFSRLGAAMGAYGFVPDSLAGAVVSNDFPGFIVDASRLIPSYFSWFSQTKPFVNACARATEGSGRMRLREDRLMSLEIELPPLEEQRRAVRRIEQLSARQRRALRVSDASRIEIESLTRAVAARVFETALDAGTVLMGGVVRFERGRFSVRPRNDPRLFGGDHPWIQIGEIEAANKHIRRWSQTLNDAGLAVSKKFPRGTVVVSIAATIGSVGILDFDCCVPDSIVAALPGGAVDADFLYHYLRYLRGHLEQVAPQSAQKNINLKILGSLPFPHVSLDAQARIADYLDMVDAREGAVRRLSRDRQRAVEAFLPSLLAREME